MLVLVNLLYYCSGANLGRCTNIQIQEKWKMFNIYTFNTLYLNRELGEGGIIFVAPWSNIFVVHESWCSETPLCSVIEVDSLKRKLLQSLIMNHKYQANTHTLKKLSRVNSFFFLLFFSPSKGKREVERQVQHLFCKGIKLKIRLKNITVLFNMNISFIKTNIS